MCIRDRRESLALASPSRQPGRDLFEPGRLSLVERSLRGNHSRLADFPLEWLGLLFNRRGQLRQAAEVNSRSSERNSEVPPCRAIAPRESLALASPSRQPGRTWPFIPCRAIAPRESLALGRFPSVRNVDLLLNRRGQLSQAAEVNSRSSERNSEVPPCRAIAPRESIALASPSRQPGRDMVEPGRLSLVERSLRGNHSRLLVQAARSRLGRT